MLTIVPRCCSQLSINTIESSSPKWHLLTKNFHFHKPQETKNALLRSDTLAIERGCAVTKLARANYQTIVVRNRQQSKRTRSEFSTDANSKIYVPLSLSRGRADVLNRWHFLRNTLLCQNTFASSTQLVYSKSLCVS